MKSQVKRFKNLEIFLKELEKFVRHGEHLQTGRPFKNFGGMLSREVLANWLICVVGNFAEKSDRFTFSNDPEGGDGIIYDRKAETPYPTASSRGSTGRRPTGYRLSNLM